jgi:hypothetical protein
MDTTWAIRKLERAPGLVLRPDAETTAPLAAAAGVNAER